MAASRLRSLRVEHLEARNLLAADFEMLADVNVRPGDAGSSPADFVRLGEFTYFTANSEDSGRELWRTDGTTAGTTLVKDINPGMASSFSVSTQTSDPALIKWGDALFFRANDGVHGVELWRTDGTPEGTVLVKDINPAGNGMQSSTAGRYGPVLSGNALYFSAFVSATGWELWKSDGTEAGTVLVKNAVPGSASFNPNSLIDVNGLLFFKGGSSALWKSDGTAAGTTQVTPQNVSVDTSYRGSMAAIGNVLYFAAGTTATGVELWRSDGTAVGTALVKEIRAGSTGSTPASLTPVGNTLYYTARTVAEGRELWKSDGTAAGTVIVADLTAGTGDTFDNPTAQSYAMYAFAGRIYFGDRLGEMRMSDGTAAGTTLISTASTYPTSYASVGDRLFLTSAAATYDAFYIDADASSLIKIVSPPPKKVSAFASLYNSDGNLFLAGSIGGSASELLSLSPETLSYTLVADLLQTTGSSNARNFLKIGDTLYFAAFGDAPELWKTDGTAAGTVRLKTFNHYVIFAVPTLFTEVNGMLFFVQQELGLGTTLWRSDGTEAGTIRIHAGTNAVDDADPSLLTALDGYLYFVPNNASQGRELWRTDGTVEGTTLVKEMFPGPEHGLAYSGDIQMIAHDGVLYLPGIDPDHSQELWRSDGTAAGTYLLKEFVPGAIGAGIDLRRAVSVEGQLYFGVYSRIDDELQQAVWRTDGTAEGTVKVVNAPFPTNNFIKPLVLGGRLFLISGDQRDDDSLWAVVDGQATHVSDLTGHIIRDVEELVVAGDRAYFNVEGRYLVMTDGSTEGTVALPSGGEFSRLTAIGLDVYFVSDGTDQIWQIDPELQTAGPVSQFVRTSPIEHLTSTGDRLVFSRDDGVHGREIWIQRPAAGDFTNDGVVDGADFLLWQRQLGDPSFAGAGADGDLDANVSASDLTVWTSNFTATSSAAATASSAAEAMSNSFDSPTESLAAARVEASGSDRHALVDEILARWSATRLSDASDLPAPRRNRFSRRGILSLS